MPPLGLVAGAARRAHEEFVERQLVRCTVHYTMHPGSLAMGPVRCWLACWKVKERFRTITS
jgi:hypothetical protein